MLASRKSRSENEIVSRSNREGVIDIALRAQCSNSYVVLRMFYKLLLPCAGYCTVLVPESNMET